MKGVIPRCLAELVIEQFGKVKWTTILEKVGLPPSTTFLVVEDVEDASVMKVLEATCKVLGLTLLQAADAFGEYWVCTYAPKIYSSYYRRANSAREFLLMMNEIHELATRSMQNARPPRFEYNWENDRTLIMTYKSQRGLIDIFVGLVKGVGVYFNQILKVKKLGPDRVRIEFPKVS